MMMTMFAVKSLVGGRMTMTMSNDLMAMVGSSLRRGGMGATSRVSAVIAFVVVLVLVVVNSMCILRVEGASEHQTAHRWQHGKGMSSVEKEALREEVRQMFLYSWDKYMSHAFPADELLPMSCAPRHRNESNRGTLDHSLGGYALTLVDGLDTLAVMGEVEHFRDAMKKFNVAVAKGDIRFNANVMVSVFEVTIRVLGGLLSAHSYATQLLPEYKGELLDAAEEVGIRLLPAFESRTGIPYSRVNLYTGEVGSDRRTTLAEAGTVLVEFAMLSRFTGQGIYEKVARRALEQLSKRKSTRSLYGGMIDVETGKWTEAISGIGAGYDSFYEYLLKSYLLLGDEEYLILFEEAYHSVMYHMKQPDNTFLDVDMENGNLVRTHITSLQAFWPGLQVLAGDVTNAIKSYLKFFQVWRRFGMMPEAWDFTRNQVIRMDYPLRPELMESTWMLYQATRHPFFLEAGKEFVGDINQWCRAPCGYASVADAAQLYQDAKGVIFKRKDDRMDSFFLSETLKYLYLLFDEDNVLNQDSHYVFSTEGHPFKAEKTHKGGKRKSKIGYSSLPQSCPLPPGFEEISNLILSASVKAKENHGEYVPPPSQKPLEVIADSTRPQVNNVIHSVAVEVTEYVELEYKDAEKYQRPESIIGTPARFGPKIKPATLLDLVYENGNDWCQPPYKKKYPGKAVLIDRGNCNFAEKVINAQESGAKMVIITDNVVTKVPIVEDVDDKMQNVLTQISVLVSMTSDEHLKKEVTIPSIFISHQDGNLLKSIIGKAWNKINIKPGNVPIYPMQDGNIRVANNVVESSNQNGVFLTVGQAQSITISNGKVIVKAEGQEFEVPLAMLQTFGIEVQEDEMVLPDEELEVGYLKKEEKKGGQEGSHSRENNDDEEVEEEDGTVKDNDEGEAEDEDDDNDNDEELLALEAPEDQETNDIVDLTASTILTPEMLDNIKSEAAKGDTVDKETTNEIIDREL